MPSTRILNEDVKGRFVELSSEMPIDEKPEYMTHLRGNILVPKNAPRIAFRGKLDSLEAKILETQIIASDDNCPAVVKELEELYEFVRSILGAECKEIPLEPVNLLGMNSVELRRVSHNVKSEFGIPHLVPSYKMGRLCIALNALRTIVRETEIAAVRTFCDESTCSRYDIVEALNRLSSCVYIMFCKRVAENYKEYVL